MKKMMICLVMIAAGLAATANNASAMVVSPLDAGQAGGGSVQGTFETAGFGHRAAPAGWTAAPGSQAVDLYSDQGMNTALCLTWPSTTNETFTAQYTYTSTPAAANKLYTLKLLAGSHVNWESGTVDFTFTLGTDNGGTFTEIGSSTTKTVTYNGQSSYLGSMSGTYVSDFKVISGSSVPAGNLVVRIRVVTHGVNWGAFDNVSLDVTDAIEPIIINQPVSKSVKIGANTAFTVSGQNIVSYRWYKGTTVLSDGGNITGALTNTLNISNVAVSDEGEYFCKVSSGSSEIDSDKASLIAGRLIAQWQFDGNLNDSSDLHNNGTAVGTVEYGTGINGVANSALVLNNEAGIATNFVKVANPVFSTSAALPTTDFLSYTFGAVSISCWVKPSFLNEYEMFVSVGYPDFDGAWYCSRFGTTGGATLNSTGKSKTIVTKDFNDGNWHLYTAVIDPTANARYIYLDGTLQDQDTATLIPGVELIIGAINWKERLVPGAADSYQYGFSGSIDDMRIYTYAMAATEVAQMYYDVTGKAGCLNYQSSDFNKDCRVNFADFEVFAQNWLNCSLLPASACN
jgi:hypothetical protein